MTYNAALGKYGFGRFGAIHDLGEAEGAAVASTA